MPVVRLVLVALAASLLSVPGSASAVDGYANFTDSGRTVACEITTADAYGLQGGVRCDVLGAPPNGTPLPPRPDNCEADWNSTVTMPEYGLPHWGACVGGSIESGEALAAGTVVEAGAFRCTVLAAGASCRDTELGYGFQVTPTTLTYLRPKAKSVLSAEGLGKLKLGMTVKRARRTGYLAPGAVCGSPQLKRAKHLNVYLDWKKRRFHGLLANHYTNAQATKGVGVGSSLGEVQARYRGSVRATTDHVEGARAYVYVVRGKRGILVFILDGPSTRSPVATDPVGAVWLTRKWNPKSGFGFSGC
jgi:hypothetical protein